MLRSMLKEERSDGLNVECLRPLAVLQLVATSKLNPPIVGKRRRRYYTFSSRLGRLGTLKGHFA